MRSLRPLAASGLSNLPDNPTPLPDDGPPLSSGYREHRRILYTEPDDNKPPYLCRILGPPSRLSGFVEAWEPLITLRCFDTGPIQDLRPLDRAQWSHDLYG